MEAFLLPDGRGISLLQAAVPIDQLKAVAVSLEPENVPVTKPTKVVTLRRLGEHASNRGQWKNEEKKTHRS